MKVLGTAKNPLHNPLLCHIYDQICFDSTPQTNNILLIGTPLAKNTLFSGTLPAINNLFAGTHLPIYIFTGTQPNIIGQMSEETCVFRHLTDKRLENKKFKVSVKCLFFLLWIGHLTYRSYVYWSDGV